MTVTINGATGIAGVNGTATLPAVQGGDTNTGVYFPAVDEVGLTAGGSQVLLVNASGSTVTGTQSVSGNLSFNSGYGSAAVAYGCRAWVNFNGIANTNLTGTYSQSGTTVTVTATAHEYIVGSSINADITSGLGVDGIYTVTGVTNANTFTYTAGTSLTTSGTISLLRNTIRASGNVSSVTDNGTGDYTVNFATALPDDVYAAVFSVAQNYSSYDSVFQDSGKVLSRSASSVRIQTNNDDASTSASLADMIEVSLTIFR